MSDSIPKLIAAAIKQANVGERRKAALAHLFVVCIKAHTRSGSVPMGDVQDAITADILPQLPALEPTPAAQVLFRLSEAEASLIAFQETHCPAPPAARVLLLWLLEGKPIPDPTLATCRDICRAKGVTPAFVRVDSGDKAADGLGFGSWLDPVWASSLLTY